MSLFSPISRVISYGKRNGLWATVRRFRLAGERALFANRMALFYCDLPALTASKSGLAPSLKVERYANQRDLIPGDLKEITSFWNPGQARRNIDERFRLGALLWLIKFKNELAGYGWTLQGRTVEPHYFPLGENDIQFLDFHVFPKFRGRAIDWCLMTYILYQLAAEGKARAYGEAAEWNKASLSSFAMSPFRRLGWGKKYTILGRTIVWWCRESAIETKRESRIQAISRLKGEGAKLPNLQS
jgi:ribosomal protein S18 acetylase RimI-like enzyme